MRAFLALALAVLGLGASDEACRAAVCVTGQWRTFADARVRAALRDVLLPGLAGNVTTPGAAAPPHCAIDVFFRVGAHDSAAPSSGRGAKNAGFDRGGVPPLAPTTAETIRATLAAEFPEVIARFRVCVGTPAGIRVRDTPEALTRSLCLACSPDRPKVLAARPPRLDIVERDAFVANDCGDAAPAPYALPSLYNAFACFESVRETERARARR